MSLASAKPLTTNLEPWDTQKSLAAAEAVKELLETDGWGYLLEAVHSRFRQIQQDLMLRKPTDVAAEYAALTGQQRGLASIEQIAEGIIENGRRAEARLRLNEEDSPVG